MYVHAGLCVHDEATFRPTLRLFLILFARFLWFLTLAELFRVRPKVDVKMCSFLSPAALLIFITRSTRAKIVAPDFSVVAYNLLHCVAAYHLLHQLKMW